MKTQEIKTGHYVDVKKHEIFNAKIIIRDGRVAEICPVQGPVEECYIMPGFIDSHIHIESTLLKPSRFAQLAVAQGTVGVVADPHEIANVLGVEGIEYMIADAKRVNFHFSFGIPSGVPCTMDFETSGAKLDSDDVAHLLPRDEFYGLAEMMNYVGLLNGDLEANRKVTLTKEAGKVVDGHAPGLVGENARRYIAKGVSTDHEMYDLEHARERIALGMKIQIREGSAARNFDTLSPLLLDHRNKGMLMFCTDDIYPDDLCRGHINAMASKAIQKGADLWQVLDAACVTPVAHYHLPIGLLQEGDAADFVVVDNLEDFHVRETWIAGEKVFSATDTAFDIWMNVAPSVEENEHYPNQFRARPLQFEDVRVACQEGRLKVIESHEQELLTGKLLVPPRVVEGFVESDVDRDIIKMVVYNRYQPAKPAVAFVRGFGLKKGALASTIAHDSHNIIAVGASDEDLLEAVNALVECQGGLCVVGEGERRVLPLPIAGLMSPDEGLAVAEQHVKLKTLSVRLGCRYKAPFMTLAFMALPVIPELKLTDKGLFDVTLFSPTALFE